MPTLLLTGGRVIDPASGTDRTADVAVENGRIAAIAPDLPRSADRTIDCTDRIVCPGLIDPHVHLREPGHTQAETIETGSLAAVAGGFATVCCMPNTRPTLDTPELVEWVRIKAEANAACRVFPIAAATTGRSGEQLAPHALLAQGGAVGFSDDGDVIASAGMMARVLRSVRPTGLAVMQHCQEPTLTDGAQVHAGDVSMRLGLTGWPRAGEEMIIDRDLHLVRAIECRYHVQHLSCAVSVDIVRRALEEGLPVSAEASPHHLLLIDESVERGIAVRPPADGRTPPPDRAMNPAYWTNAKVNPPLREPDDVEAVRRGVAEGVITVLATDHAPHTGDDKARPFEAAPFGMIGLETAVALYAEALVHTGLIDWAKLIELMTINPARLCGLDACGLGQLAEGGPADITIIDPDAAWTITPDTFAGRSRNTPFIGWDMRGRAVATIVGGALRYEI